MAKGVAKPILYLVGQSVDVVNLHLSPSVSTLADETGRHWLDLRFDDEPFVYDWTKTERIDWLALKRLLQNDYQVITNSDNDHKEIWYQLEVEGQTKLFQPKKSNSMWRDPETKPNLIYISRTANLSDSDLREIAKYRLDNPDVKIICDRPIDPRLIELADWVLLTIQNRAQAMTQISRFKNSHRIFVQADDGRWWISDGEKILEGHSLAGLPDGEWLKLILSLSTQPCNIEDEAGLITLGIEQIKSGQELNLVDVDMDYLDFEHIKVLAGTPDFRRQINKIRRTLDSKKLPLLHLDNLSALAKVFQSKNYNEFIKLILQEPLSDGFSAVLFDPQIVASFGQIDLPRDIRLAIRVDTGYEQLPGFAKERITTGLDGLDKRLSMYRQNGFDVASWRLWAALDDTLSDTAILSNAHLAARFAKISQNAGLLPMVELKTSGRDIVKLNRLIKSVAQEMKLFKVDLSTVALLLSDQEVDLKTAELDQDALPMLIFSSGPTKSLSLPVVRDTLVSAVELANSLPSPEIIPEIKVELKKLFQP